MLPSASRRGFTLIELCVAICLALLLLSVALPSLTGQLSHQRLQQAYDRLDRLVGEAQKRSTTEGKSYELVWGEGGVIGLFPADWSPKERKAGPMASLVPQANRERYTLVRDASLTRAPSPIWTFWPSGNCEPVSVRFDAPIGVWTAEFNPLSARGTLTRFVAR